MSKGLGSPTGRDGSGVWTLTIADGTYALSCRPLEDPERDCGGGYDGTVLDPVFEAGLVQGPGTRCSSSTTRKSSSELTGCSLPCAPLPTIQVDWALAGEAMTFSEMKGEYTAYHLTIEPLQKIG